MKSLLVAAGAVLALSFVGSSHASARHHGSRSGYRGVYISGDSRGGYSSPRLSVSVGYGNVRGYPRQNFGYSGFNGYPGHGEFRSHRGRAHRTWHDTSHLDYHGPSLVPHRGHLDYIPGHYDVHRTGHWDRH